MIKYRLFFHKNTLADKSKLKAAKLLDKAQKLCALLEGDPRPAISKQLQGDLLGKRSIRINLQHRLVYEIFEEEKIVHILSMWSHYE